MMSLTSRRTRRLTRSKPRATISRGRSIPTNSIAEDDEQAEGLARVLEDSIGGESEDVLYDDDDVVDDDDDEEEEYVDDDSDDGDGDY